jgi:antitoxin MazE
VKAGIQKWGNSLGLRIPGDVVHQLRLAENSQLELRVEAGSIVLQPQLSREDMINQITDQNRHDLVDWGPRRGREIW